MNHLFLVVVSALSLCSAMAQTGVADLKRTAVPLSSLEISFVGDSDLQASFTNFLPDKDIVGMGEASHAASEFFKAKARIFRFLAERHGFRVFAIESTLGSTCPLNCYLLYGQGDKKSALAALDNMFWNTAEVLELVDWMREWNIAHVEPVDKVFFLGFDVNTPALAAKSIAYYLQKVDTAFSTTYAPNMTSKLLARGNFFNEARERLAQKQAEYCAKSAYWEYKIAERAFVNIEQAAQPKGFSYRVRDKSMADNVQWIAETWGSKVFLWAHNYHIAKHGWLGPKTMGEYLSETFGERYGCIGFDFQDGNIWAKRGGNMVEVILHGNHVRLYQTHAPHSGKNNFTWHLAQVGLPMFFLDLGVLAQKSPFWASRLAAPFRMHNTDEWSAKRKEYPNIEVGRAYDAIVFVRTVSPSQHFRIMEKAAKRP